MARLKLMERLADRISGHRPVYPEHFDGTLTGAPFWAGIHRGFSEGKEDPRGEVYERAIAKLTPEEVKVVEEVVNLSLLHWWDSCVEPLAAGIRRLTEETTLGWSELLDLESLGRA